MNRSHYLLLGLAVAVLPACLDSATEPEVTPCDPFLLQYQAATGDTVTTTEGVRYIDIETGTGGVEAEAGDIALVDYTGYLLDSGQLFESTCVSGLSATSFQLGDPNLIEGFSIGIIGMQAGSVRRIIIPAELGFTIETHQLYGEDLIFDLNLVELN